MTRQVPVDETARAEENEQNGIHEVLPDLAYQRHVLVNVAYVGTSKEWVLVDCGIPGSKDGILAAVGSRFGEQSRPVAIVMTHGHFDHTGALEDLARAWDVPVYAHQAELRYLNGSEKYPSPDPTVGGGMMAAMAKLYPRGPVNVSEHLQALPGDGTIPGMPGWLWIHTPGHTAGHVALWRADDRTMLSGDAFITTNQESAYAVATQRLEIHGPPMYYTQDWEAARASVERLNELQPELVVSGHGRAMSGPQMRNALRILSRDFEEVAVPKHGKYVEDPVYTPEMPHTRRSDKGMTQP